MALAAAGLAANVAAAALYADTAPYVGFLVLVRSALPGMALAAAAAAVAVLGRGGAGPMALAAGSLFFAAPSLSVGLAQRSTAWVLVGAVGYLAVPAVVLAALLFPTGRLSGGPPGGRRPGCTARRGHLSRPGRDLRPRWLGLVPMPGQPARRPGPRGRRLPGARRRAVWCRWRRWRSGFSASGRRGRVAAGCPRGVRRTFTGSRSAGSLSMLRSSARPAGAAGVRAVRMRRWRCYRSVRRRIRRAPTEPSPCGRPPAGGSRRGPAAAPPAAGRPGDR